MIDIVIFSLNWITCSLKKSSMICFKDKTPCLKNYHVVSEVIHWHRSLLREATASFLNKGSVQGSGKKPFAQKGRGMARQGSFKNPHQRGGGVAFGIQNRNYNYKLNRKKRHLALKMIFHLQLALNKVQVVENLHMYKPSSNTVNKFFKQKKYKKVLVIDNKNLYLKLSLNNTKTSKFLNFKGMNTLDMLKYSKIIITKNVINKILFKFERISNG